MTLADGAGLAKLVLDVAKFFWEAAQKDKGGVLKRGQLMDLHERLVQASAATKAYEAAVRDPILSASKDALESRWVADFQSAVNALTDIDIAAMRVYAPELMTEIEEKLMVTDLLLAHEMANLVHTESQKRLLSIAERISQIPNAVMFPLVHFPQSSPTLHAMREEIDSTVSELGKFIRQYWPSPEQATNM